MPRASQMLKMAAIRVGIERSICPKCSQPLPENYAAAVCPFCREELPDVAVLKTVAMPPVPLSSTKVNWWYFFVVLFLPPVGSFLSALGNSDLGFFFFTVIGNFVSDIACTVVLLRRLRLEGGMRVMAAVLIFISLAVISQVLCLPGCSMELGRTLVGPH